MRGLEALIGHGGGYSPDRSRPLWEMHVCQPFEDGRVAVITKMHHALADGVAANALMSGLVDGQGTDVRPARDRPSAAQELEQTPGRLTQVRMALVGAFLQIGSLPGLLSRTVSAVASLVRHRAPRPSGCPGRSSTRRARASTGP